MPLMTQVPLWRWSELCDALNQPVEFRAAGGPDVSRVVVDSRLCQAGDLFVALPGDPGPRFNPSSRSSADGHDHIDDAVEHGAVAVLVQRPEFAEHLLGAKALTISDTYDGLWDLGRYARGRLTSPLVAVTGSSGKTTAKTFLAAATGGYGSPGSFNNHIGVPLTLANAPAGKPLYVAEVGTNHPGEIAPLSRLAAPDLAILLNVHAAHIENFPSHEALVAEKCDIFEGLTDRNHAVWEHSLALDYGYSFGVDRQAHCVLSSLQGDRANYQLFGETLTARVPGAARHNAMTLAAVLLSLKLLDFPLSAALELEEAVIPAGRGRRHEVVGVTVVDQSYNANPDSMRAALEAFAAIPARRRLVFIGEMLELGDEAAPAHLALANPLAQFEKVVCVGAGSEALAQTIDAEFYAAAEDVELERFADQLETGDAVFVKGSNRVFWQHQFVPELLSVLNSKLT